MKKILQKGLTYEYVCVIIDKSKQKGQIARIISRRLIMKKILSIALMIAMIAMSVCAFTSCDALAATSAISKADKALTEDELLILYRALY